MTTFKKLTNSGRDVPNDDFNVNAAPVRNACALLVEIFLIGKRTKIHGRQISTT